MASSTVAVKFTGDTASLKRAIDDTDRKMHGLGGKFSKFGGIAAAGLAGGAAAVGVFAASSITAFAEAEEKQAALSAAFEKFPQLAGANIDKLRELNESLAKKTKFDDDATASGQAVLAGFGLTADELAAVTPLLQDYAAKTGKDMPTAAKDLGKAVQGQGRALKGVGINFKDTGSAAGNLEQLMGGLNDKVGGFAESQGKTAAGQAEILKNQFGELQEEVGSKLVPILLELATWFNESVIPAIERVVAVVQEHWPQVQATIQNAVQGIINFVTPIVQALQALWDKFGNNILDLMQRIWPNIKQIIEGVMTVIRGIIQTITSLIKGDWSGVWNGIKSIFSGVWSAIQGIVKGAIEVVRSVIGVALETIGTLWKRAWDGISTKVSQVWTSIKDIVGGAILTLVGWVSALPGHFVDGLSTLASALTSPFKEAFNAIAGFWNDTVGSLSFKVPGWVPGFGGKGWDVPDIPELHDGGIVPGGRTNEPLMRLQGGEGVFTPQQMAAMGGGGTQIIQLVVEGRVLAEVVRRHERALR